MNIFQGQERQDDLDLGRDSFKFRNYDYAIGRFFNVDPLAEKFPYNGVYNFSENRVVNAVELEGVEYTSVDAIQNRRATNGLSARQKTEVYKQTIRQTGNVLKTFIRYITPIEDYMELLQEKILMGINMIEEKRRRGFLLVLYRVQKLPK